MKRMNNRIDFLISRRDAQMNRILNKYNIKIQNELSKNKGVDTMPKYKSRLMSCSRTKSKGWGGVKLKP